MFDTGGTNLKPFTGMLDMHTDMQGSAVALGTLLALAELRVPFGIDAWLAITENRLAADAYKPQDLVTAVDGTTIQVIHTDAEGRMVLADTLALAAREKPALIIDYATLTGSCVMALTERYSGVFSNRIAANALLQQAGAASGERVWPFPMDDDYDELLKSDVADIKQCSAETRRRSHSRRTLPVALRAESDSVDPPRLERRPAQRRPRSRADRDHGLRRAPDRRAPDAHDGGRRRSREDGSAHEPRRSGGARQPKRRCRRSPRAFAASCP